MLPHEQSQADAGILSKASGLVMNMEVIGSSLAGSVPLT